MVFPLPPPIVDSLAQEQFESPPPIKLAIPAVVIVLAYPPPINDVSPDALFKHPPTIVDLLPKAVLS